MSIQKQSNIKALKIGIASPERILSWSHGEVTKSETINYKTLKPEPGGLFDEAIFGPVKNYECACGKYKKVKFKGKTCEKCNVDITDAIVRRERMGHIQLASRVAHIWMTKELPNPSKISLLLDISYKEVEQVVYFVNYIILDEGDYRYNDEKIFKQKEIVDLSSQKHSTKNRNKLRRILKDIQAKIKAEKGRSDFDYQRAVTYDLILAEKNLPFSIQEVFKFITKYTKIKFGVGAEAIYELLKNIDFNEEYNHINEQLKEHEDLSNAKARKLLVRLETIKWFKESNNKPEWMIMDVIPVTPPDTRPIIQLDGGRFTTSDINNFYRKIIIRNQRLKKLSDDYAPDILMNNERRMLQEAVDALFDNSSRKKPVVGRDRRPLKSLSNHLKGKQGLFRQNLLGKRVDYSGRSVIVIGPELKMYEVGIPIDMILKLFKPFIIHELIRKYDDNGNEKIPYFSSIKQAENAISKQENVIWPIVEKVIKTRPVLLNRAPTLHRLGIQSFEVKMVEGKAIRLHPLVTTAFNADFDGDQMAVHVPLSKEAIAEARSIMLASWHILGPKDGKPIIAPTQDMVLGIYYISKEQKNGLGEGLIFNDKDEVLRALNDKKVGIHSIIGIPTSAYPEKQFKENGLEGILITTPGKIIFNDKLPSDFMYINSPKHIGTIDPNMIVKKGENFKEIIKSKPVITPFDKKTLSSIINELYKKYNYNEEIVPHVMDDIKSLGFYYSMISATSISAFDVPEYTEKYKYFQEADDKVLKIKSFAEKGLLNDDERYTQVVKLWNNVKDKVTHDINNLVKSDEFANNSIVIMADSGARGNTSNFTQLAGMRGLMSKSYNYDQKRNSKVIKDTIEVPIKHSFIEGLTVSEYFNSSYGARKGMTDTAMKTSKSGYMTRKLVDATQEVIINDSDCGVKRGIKVSKIIGDDNNIIEPLYDRIYGRNSMFDIVHKNETIVKANEMITHEIAQKIIDAGIEEVEVRSSLRCESKSGICQKCFGLDLSTNNEIKKGSAIGVIAAQSIGEPGTQLTMRTFHTGGVAGGSNIAQGFERLKQLFDCIEPKAWEKATISEIHGTVTSIVQENEDQTITIKNNNEEIEYNVSINLPLCVQVGDNVVPGTRLNDGSIDMHELLKVAGIDRVCDYLIKEVQKVYRSQGIEISDKYIEVIVRQLTSKLVVVNPCDSNLSMGQIISNNEFKTISQKMILEGKTPPIIINEIFGLDVAPSLSGSFLSAASFQNTKKILTDSAAIGQVDNLVGLKENVILGNLIPAGTGLQTPEEVIRFGEEMLNKEY